MFKKRFFSAFAALAVLFSAFPASASGMSIGGLPVGVELEVDVVDLFNFIRADGTYMWNTLQGFIDHETCPYAPTLGGGHKFEPVRTLVNGQIGLYYQCEYCHKNYGEALKEEYAGYVETLPGTTYNSAGKFLWVPGAGDFVTGKIGVSVYCSDASSLGSSGNIDLSSAFPSLSLSFKNRNNQSFNGTVLAYVGDSVRISYSGDVYNSLCFRFNWGSLRAPVSGTYTVASSGVILGGSFFSAGGTFSAGSGTVYTVSTPQGKGTLTQNYPWVSFYVEPYAGGSGGNTYDIQTRINGFENSGKFGYVENGQLVQSSVGTIFNETNNTYQNPITGDSHDVASWNYDYVDRSYTITTTQGDTVTVQYGDENVTINDAGQTYNVYYLVSEPESVGEDSTCVHNYVSQVTTPPTCGGAGVKTTTCAECGKSYTESVPALGHNYVSSVTVEATCENTGVTTYTCSNCGDSYTRPIPKKGHTWQVFQTVATQYDENGVMTQEGYTLYQCAECGGQYRITAQSSGSALPSPSSDGVNAGNAGLSGLELDSDVGKGFLPMIAQGLTQDLPQALEAVSGWFSRYPEYYKGFSDFLRDGIAGCLPAEIRAMIGIGFGMLLFLGILKRVAGR